MRPGTQPEQPRQLVAYETWYSCGKDFSKCFETLRNNPGVYRWPKHVQVLYNWARDYKWEERARQIDADLAKARMDTIIKEQQQFLEKKRNVGLLLQREALKYLNSTANPNDPNAKVGHGIDNAATAVAALKAGLEFESSAMALPDFIVELLNTDPETLRLLYERTRAEIAESENSGTGYEDQGSEAQGFAPTAIGPVPENSGGPG